MVRDQEPSPPARWTRVALPSYRHLPGRTPHPLRDRCGHSHAGTRLPAAPPVSLPEEWRRSTPYLYGVDLFNRGYFWEAHEAWEEPWRAALASSQVAAFLQGLIQVAAALLQDRLGHAAGAERLFRRGRGRLESTGPAVFMGLAAPSWCREVAAYRSRRTTSFPFLRLDVHG